MWYIMNHMEDTTKNNLQKSVKLSFSLMGRFKYNNETFHFETMVPIYPLNFVIKQVLLEKDTATKEKLTEEIILEIKFLVNKNCENKFVVYVMRY